jgi:hypothetical protein
MEENTVVGHIVSSNCGWIPALEQSTELFQAVVSDDISKLETLFDASTCLTTGVPVLYWGADKKVEVKSRTLAMLAAQHGSLRVLSFLLSKGADPKQMSIDGLTCYEVGRALRTLCVDLAVMRTLVKAAHLATRPAMGAGWT